ncbi:MAG: dinitrogenase iron-molybdenum cofactor biosynthesis protein [Chlorobi bacterium]|nr:dinitrogenase iron-molybdenum cofactor biosynthesis protein [Chlorobiota bacterium]
MRIAFTTKTTDENSEIDARFGRANFFMIYDDDADKYEVIENKEAVEMGHGAGPKAAQTLFVNNPDVVITGNGPGGNAASIFTRKGIKVYIGAAEMTIKQAYEAYKNNELKEF